VAEKDFVIVHGPFFGPRPACELDFSGDIVRITDGILVEHWDVIQNAVTQEQSKSGQPMFGDKFAI
jgi:predicted SnoaL-like aldol condensation-catalyzing enzyme